MHNQADQRSVTGGQAGSFKVYRRSVQLLFVFTIILIGYQFLLFTGQLEAGMIPTVGRPPGVEAFLPISALLSVKHFFMTRVINSIHPSGLLIFGFISLTALLWKKSFCSWVCPIGFLSEVLGQTRIRRMKKRIKLPKWADIPLRGIKYLLLGFFIRTVFFKMNSHTVEQFIYSPFNVISDIKMLKFFTEMSVTAAVILTIICILTFIIHHFWCRYLCPYGAWLGLVSFLSPYKIRRDETACISCGKCDRACPGHIRISRAETVVSDECFACGKCIDTCPENKVLSLSLTGHRAALKPWVVAIAVLIIFGGGSVGARFADTWQNQVTGKQYLSYMVISGLIRPDRIENMAAFVANLDQLAKRQFMIQMQKKLAAGSRK